MSRTNIFELLAENNTISKDVKRLDTLFTSVCCFEEDPESYQARERWTLKRFVDQFCFTKWKNRHRCLDVEDYLNTIGYDDLLSIAKCDSLEDFLTIIEIIYNFWHLALDHFPENSFPSIIPSRYNNGIETILEISNFMNDCLSEYNQKAYYFKDDEKCIVAEDSPQVTSAAEASEPEIAIEIVRYNHRQLKGDIAKKKAILRALGDHLEGRKKEICNINATLYNNITASLNNLNIRHNNITPENRSYYHKAVAEMPNEELEQHYDDLYQLILLAILEMDNVERQRQMRELIQKVSE